MIHLTAIITLAGFAATGAAPPSAQPPLVVCAIPNSMPRMGKTADGAPQGLDVAVVQLVAKELKRSLEFHWCASAACSWSCVREKRCDIVIGQPHGSGPAKEIAWSNPYCGSRYGLVVHKDATGIRSLSDLGGRRVGMVTGSVAAALEEYTPVQFKTREELLDQFVASKLDAALVDDDFAAWHLHQHPKLPLVRVAEYVPRERWNMGFAVRSADTALLQEINRALTILLGNGTISKACAEQGVSYRAPFSESDRKSAPIRQAWNRIRERGELVVTLDPANLPYSAATPEREGCDVELARAVAQQLGVKLQLNWIDIHRETAIGELLDGECDLAFGAAVEPGAVDDEVELGDRVIYSRPYYGTGYLLVTRKGGPSAKSLSELSGEKSRRLGAEAGSLADYRLRQQGYLRRLFRNQLSVLKSLSDGGIDYAYLWANVGWTLHASPEFNVELAPGYVPEDHWNIAVAMRKGDDELKRHVDEALGKLIDDGTVVRTLSGCHVPYFPPFDANDQPKSDASKPDGVIRHPPTDRGPEPQMQRRQRSKTRYAGLEKIRSAGVLVVGLDQSCLPFSTAHPEPAGLDYEIAVLLAEKLGVELKVYWAYSSHDSYPSKLATKDLCDVMLGVMPDDRFGNRVAFTKPYYYADYRFVVPASANAPNRETPLAVERGLALRGVRERAAREYPSLESILAAVAAGKEQAGYVTSTRGSWLAAERWSGQLKFLRDESQSDRFPICAAVRKSDGDLRDAIEQALNELAQSGNLAEVFNRWHIPYESSP